MIDICDPCFNHCFVLADKLNLCPLIREAKNVSDFNTKKCDNCGKMKLDNNGWFIARYGSDPLVIVISHHNSPELPIMNIKQKGPSMQILDLCGQTCLIEKMSKLLGGVKNVGASGDTNRPKEGETGYKEENYNLGRDEQMGR